MANEKMVINKQIIPIPRVSKETIEFLIKVGILYVDETGLHVSEQ